MMKRTSPQILPGFFLSLSLSLSGCTLLVDMQNEQATPDTLVAASPDVGIFEDGGVLLAPDVEPSVAPDVEPSVGPGANPTPSPAVSPDVDPIDGGVGCLTDALFFATHVEPILNDCMGCHVTDGPAAGTRMVFNAAGDDDATLANFATLKSIADLTSVNMPLYIQKPTMILPHNGGELFDANSAEVAFLSEMTNRFRQPGSCENPGAITCEMVGNNVQPEVRRLSNMELTRSLQDVFPNVTLSGFQFLAENSRNLFDNQSLSTSPSSIGIRYERANAQLVAAAVVAQDLNGVVPCASRDAVCGRTFVQQVGRKLFRRPLSEDEEDLYAQFFESGVVADDFDLSVEMSLQAMLMSPVFLYKIEIGNAPNEATTEITDFETAVRLSYFLWGTTPDDALLDAAATGALGTQAGLAAEVDRMLASPKAVEGLMHLMRYWLDIEAVQRTVKPVETGFDDQTRDGLQEESERFLRDIVLGENPTLTTLMTSNETYVNDAIASIYNMPAPANGTWERVTHTEPRFGVLTQGGFLASRGHATQPSPIRRAKFILERLMCYELGAPPAAAEGAVVEQSDQQTNRQATDALTLNGGCRGCHVIMNPIGFPLEAYGALGAMRSVDNGLPIDASGGFAAGTFDGASGLSDFLLESPLVRQCVAKRFSQYALGHTVTGGECMIADVTESFVNSGTNLLQLVRAIAIHPAFARGSLDKSFTGENP